MNELQVLNIEGVECYEKDGTAYLKLETAARGLGFTKTDIKVSETGFRKEYVRIDWPRVEKYLSDFGMPTCKHDVFIPENIFYRLAMKAKSEVAEAFQAKIADEVIPSIRKTGHYSLNLGKYEALIPKDYPSALRALADQVDKNEKLQQVIADYEPKVDYYSKILKSKNGLAVTQIAKDYGMSAYSLNKILEEEHIQYKVNGQWVLYQKIADMGYTKSETVPIIYPDGTEGSKTSTRWTQRGRLKIHEILTRRGIKAKTDNEQ